MKELQDPYSPYGQEHFNIDTLGGIGLGKRSADRPLPNLGPQERVLESYIPDEFQTKFDNMRARRYFQSWLT